MIVSKLIVDPSIEVGTMTIDGNKFIVLTIGTGGEKKKSFLVPQEKCRALAEGLVTAADAANAPEFMQ